MTNTKGPRETEMITALEEARGLQGLDAFEAAVALMDQADDLNLEDDHDGADDCLAAAKLARDYARTQVESDLADGSLSDEDVKNWENLQKLV